jgi:hypothetical protein
MKRERTFVNERWAVETEMNFVANGYFALQEAFHARQVFDRAECVGLQ